MTPTKAAAGGQAFLFIFLFIFLFFLLQKWRI